MLVKVIENDTPFKVGDIVRVSPHPDTNNRDEFWIKAGHENQPNNLDYLLWKNRCVVLKLKDYIKQL